MAPQTPRARDTLANSFHTALALAVPAAAAGLAYLNARHFIGYDLKTITSILIAGIRLGRLEKADQLNFFYKLESHALSELGNNVFLIFESRSWTYAQAYDIVLRYGAWLKSKGVQKDDIVAMDFVNSPTYVWVWYGLWSIGAKPAFINSNLTGNALVHSIKTSTARLVLVDPDCRDNFSDDVMKDHGFVPAVAMKDGQTKYGFDMDEKDIPKAVRNRTTPQGAIEAPVGSQPAEQQRQLEIVFFNDDLLTHIQSFPPTRLPDSARSDQKQTSIGMLIYTSGTTGLPKAAVMSWGRCHNGSNFVSNWLPLKGETMYTSMPLYHSAASVLGVCATLQAGSTICLSKKFSHKTFWPEIRASNATILHYVGETCRYLLSAPPSPLDKQHKIHAAFGNGLRPDVWEPFKERFDITTIYEIYAATEAPASFWNSSSNSFSAGAIGRGGSLVSLLFRGTNMVARMDPDSDPSDLLRDPSTGLCQECDWNEPGELLAALDPKAIKEKFSGYFGNEDATNKKIIRNVKKKGDAWFRSGDLVRRDKEGRWWFVDRMGDTFRWKAENVSTAEVSEAMGRHEAVDEANVYGVQVPRHDGRAGCAAVVLKSSATVASGSDMALPTEQTLRSLATHMKKELPSFAVPIWLRITREMQTTGTNKQQKMHLQKDGVDLSAAAASGDVLYWLSGDTYRKFTKRDYERIEGGDIKL